MKMQAPEITAVDIAVCMEQGLHYRIINDKWYKLR